MDALHEPPMTAAIRFIAPVAREEQHQRLPGGGAHRGPEPALRPGMTVNLTVPIEPRNALCVPVTAVFDDGDAKVVYVRGRPGSRRNAW